MATSVGLVNINCPACGEAVEVNVLLESVEVGVSSPWSLTVLGSGGALVKFAPAWAPHSCNGKMN